MSAANCIHGERGPCQCYAKTEPREYRSDYAGERYPLETRYGVVSIQPVGWGVRVETCRDTVYTNGERVFIEDPPLRINGADVRLAWYDVQLDADNRPIAIPKVEARKATKYSLEDASQAAHEKLADELPPLVEEWIAAHGDAIAAAREAYLSNQARTCEESIRELEDALDVYRARLVAIEAGDMEVSPYLNGGRRLVVDE